MGSKAIFESTAKVADHAIRSKVVAYRIGSLAGESYLPADTCGIGHRKGLTNRTPFSSAAIRFLLTTLALVAIASAVGLFVGFPTHRLEMFLLPIFTGERYVEIR